MKISINGILRDATPEEEVAILAQQEIDSNQSQPEPVPLAVTRRQILTGLALAGWITEQEAQDALSNGARPAAVEAVIASLPEDQRFPATMKWIGFQTAYRDDALVSALAVVVNKTEQDVDELFTFCSTIQ